MPKANPEIIAPETTALAAIAPAPLAIQRDPVEVIEEAIRAAEAIKRVIEAKPKPVFFNGERYLEFEDWQTVARFYGVTVMVRSTKFVELPGADSDTTICGFEAAADALLVGTNQVISSAEAMCLNDEAKWNVRPKYEWVTGHDNKRRRVKVGDEPVPLFQLRSMAQTRACAKALRNVLAWVVVLAGYRPTPAEEIMDQARDQGEGGMAHDICRECGFDLTKEEVEQAKKQWGRVLCKVCGKKGDRKLEKDMKDTINIAQAARHVGGSTA